MGFRFGNPEGVVRAKDKSSSFDSCLCPEILFELEEKDDVLLRRKEVEVKASTVALGP